MNTENIRFFIVDNLWVKREKIKNIIQGIDPEAEIEMFGHPVYLKRWLELKRGKGVKMSDKPTFVITDNEMGSVEVEQRGNYQEYKQRYGINKEVWNSLIAQEQDYKNIEGTLKVLEEFVGYLGQVFVIGQSAGLTSDTVIQPNSLKLPKSKQEVSNFYCDENEHEISFTNEKLETEVEKFKDLLHRAQNCSTN